MSAERIEREILEYLARHPGAQDTFEGIAEWWLLERWVRHETGEVRAALDRLVAAGRLGQRRGRDGRMHYRLSGVEP